MEYKHSNSHPRGAGYRAVPPFYMVVLLPLVYYPHDGLGVRWLRFLILITAALWVTMQPGIWKDVFSRLRRLTVVQKALASLLAAILCIALLQSLNSEGIFGWAPEYMGICTWLAVLILGLYSTSRSATVFQKGAVAIIFTTICALSLVLGMSQWLHSFRLTGLYLQATSMGVAGVLTFILCIYQACRQPRDWRLGASVLGAVVAALVICVSQSRLAIGMLCVLSVGALVKLMHYKQANVFTRIGVGVLGCIVMVAALALNGQRLHPNNIAKSVQYRAQIYELSVVDLLAHNSIWGNGTAELPKAINDENEVGPELKQTLRDGYVFGSTHNLFLDVWYYFGGVVAALILFVHIVAFRTVFRTPQAHTLLGCLLGVLVINALFNVPSIEILPLHAVVLGGILGSGKVNTRL